MLLMVLVVAPHLTACAGPSYYAQAISGHLGLMRSREPISDVLADSATDPVLAERLQLADQILEFASSQMDLDGNGSYRQIVITGKKAVTWNVVAAEEFSITPRTWCFPVSGCVPYRGYFDHEKATKFSEKMKSKSFDVMISPAVAYSTLGWFDDPLLDTMFQYSDEQLAGFIFHELAHQQLYIKGDTAFNEAYASFVETAGVRLWLETTGRTDQLPAWLQLEKATLQFNGLLQDTREDLSTLYASGQPDEQMRENKSVAFDDLREAYRLLVETQWGGRSYYNSLLSRELNNARLALINSYQGGACAFEKLYRSADGEMARFHQLAIDKAALDGEQRSSWLNQPCEVIASNTDL